MNRFVTDTDREYLGQSLAGLGINTGFARAVIDGSADGEIWTSALVGPDAAYARHPYGMSLVWGSRLAEAFDEVIAFLRARAGAHGDEWLQIDPQAAHLPWQHALRETIGRDLTADTRVNFEFDATRFAEYRATARTAEGWVIRPAEAGDFEFAGSVVPSAFWRDAGQFLAHGGGWRAEREGTIGALAFSSFPTYDGIEIGIETLPEARRQGLDAAVASAMITGTLARGLAPIWACRRGNASSYRLVILLGFTPSTELPYLRL